MPKAKHAPMTAKALSQRLKWRGLQKLKFYCQLCEKQMRDDNGFKCHMMSESHQRNLLIAADDPAKYISHYSDLFHRDYIALLKRRWGTTRVHCNVVYCEYVAHKEHYHMNATQWTTLTQYVNWLGEQGICEVDFQDDGTNAQGNRGGWYIKLIDRDPETERRKQEIERLAKKQKDMDERHNIKIAEMVAADAERKTALDFAEANKPDAEKVNIENHRKINLSISASKTALQKKYASDLDSNGGLGFKSLVALTAFSTSGTKEESDSLKPKAGQKREKPMTALEEIMMQGEKEKETSKQRKLEGDDALATSSLQTVSGDGLEIKGENGKKKGKIIKMPEIIQEDEEEEPWLHENIMVKVITKDLGPTYYKKKGKVLKIEASKYEAIVQMVNTNGKVKFDQTHLETVIPNINRDVMVLVGKYKGRTGVLKSIQQETGTVSVELNATDTHKAKFVTNLKYEEISKFSK